MFAKFGSILPIYASDENVIDTVTSKSFWSSIGDWAKDFLLTSGVRLLGALVLLVIGVKLIKWINNKVRNAKFMAKLPSNLQAILKNAVKIGLWVALIIALAAMMGVEMSSIVASFVSLGLVVGMALEGSLSNLACGIMILIFKPFSVGDFINYGSEKEEGVVSDVGLFYTTIKATDARTIQVPNGTLCSKPIIDYSTFDTKKLEVEMLVPINANLVKVKEVLLDVCNNCDRVIKEPKPPKVVVQSFDNWGIKIVLKVWINSMDYKKARYDLLEASKKALDENEIRFGR